MIFLSLILVIVAAVTLVLGVFQDGLALIYVSIGTCVAAMAVLGIGVLLRKRDAAATAPAAYGGNAPTGADRGTSSSAVSRAPVTPPRADEQVEVSREADTAIAPTSDADEVAAVTGDDRDEQPVRPTKKAVVRKVAAEPTAETGEVNVRRPEPGTGDDPAEDPQIAAAAAGSDGVEGAAPAPGAATSATRKVAVKKATAKKAVAKKAVAKKATGKATAKKATRASAAAGSGGTLESIRGLGPAKRDALLARFGSESAVAAASVEEISAVRGVSATMARTIKDELS